MKFLDALARKIGTWLGLEFEDELLVDPLVTVLRPYDTVFPDHAASVRADAAFGALRQVECEHLQAYNVTDFDSDRPTTYCCPDCGLQFTYTVNPSKPWFIREIVPVSGEVASRAADPRDATPGTAGPPQPYRDVLEHGHIDPMDAAL